MPDTAPSPSSFVFPHFEYLIDELLPTQEIHLIGGPTGAGKTTWLIRLLDQWRRGETVFGHASHPTPFLYVSLDRSLNGMLRIFQRMRIDPRPFTQLFPSLRDRQLGVPLMLRKYASQHPDARLIVVEGFQTGVVNINDQKEVTSYLAQIQSLCVELNLTILGVVHTSKQKQNARYENPRERIAGCMQWGGWSETVIMVEPQTDASGAESDVRVLQILPRNGRPLRFVLEFKDGLLTEQIRMTNEQKILDFCSKQPSDRVYTTEDFRGITGLKETKLIDTINILITHGRLQRIGERGRFIFIAPKSQA